MHLTNQEEKILNGELGAIKAKAMRILTTLGEIFNADKLISIQSTQIAGVSYKTIGDAGLEFLEDCSGAEVVVESRMNPAGMDLEEWREMGISKSFAEKQIRIINALTSMGVKKSCSCTPYHAGLIPEQGSHIAWSESSAVAYANSILGARTNREGGPSALSAALIGKTPNYGLHMSKNRIAEILFEIDFKMSEFDYSLLGYFIGTIAKNKIPAITGIKNATKLQLKALGAGAAAGGGVPMFMIEKNTPEYRLISHPEKITVERDDLKDVKNKMTTCGKPDVISFGCPHCSYNEIKEIINKSITEREIWVCTSREVKSRIKETYEIIPSNIRIFADTCMVVAPITDMGINCLATDSTKCAHYSQTLSNVKTIIKSREELISDN